MLDPINRDVETTLQSRIDSNEMDAYPDDLARGTEFAALGGLSLGRVAVWHVRAPQDNPVFDATKWTPASLVAAPAEAVLNQFLRCFLWI